MTGARNPYLLPLPKDSVIKIDSTSSPAHIGRLKNAIDLVAPLGTPVMAAASGVVTFVRDDSNSGGQTPDHWHESNFIVIKHENQEFTRYDHLEHRSSRVAVGQQVNAGDPIAKVGMTGYTFVPHLHFQVFVFTGFNIWTDFETLAISGFQ